LTRTEVWTEKQTRIIISAATCSTSCEDNPQEDPPLTVIILLQKKTSRIEYQKTMKRIFRRGKSGRNNKYVGEDRGGGTGDLTGSTEQVAHVLDDDDDDEVAVEHYDMDDDTLYTDTGGQTNNNNNNNNKTAANTTAAAAAASAYHEVESYYSINNANGHRVTSTAVRTTPPPDRAAQTRNLVKKFIADIWNRGELDLIPEVCSPSLRFNGNTGACPIMCIPCLHVTFTFLILSVLSILLCSFHFSYH